jgi:hypothetical protein
MLHTDETWADPPVVIGASERQVRDAISSRCSRALSGGLGWGGVPGVSYLGWPVLSVWRDLSSLGG